MKILISAAETSSDTHAAQLLGCIREQMGNRPDMKTSVEAFGIGGPKLQSVGFRTVVDARELLVMGFTEILGRIPRIFRALRLVCREAQVSRPDLAILIDYPDFHFILARKLRKLGIPIVYYIPPKVWAWRKRRVHFLRKACVRILSILPFEEAFYRSANIAVKYVGNPLVDELPLSLNRENARRQLSLGLKDPVLVLMPGSRRSEIRGHLLLMLQAATQAAQVLRQENVLQQNIVKDPERLVVLLPIPEHLREEVTRLVHSLVTSLVTDPMKALDSKIDSLLDIQISVDNAHLCLVAADAGLVKSGTSTLEAGLLRCPHTLIYKPTWVTAWIFKNLIRYRGPVGLANLIVHWQEGDQPVQSREGTLVKELLCEQVSVPALTREIVELLTDSQRRMKMLQGFELLRDLVFQKKGPQSHSSHPSHSIEMTSPSENAAREVIDVWDGLQAQAQSQGHAMLRISSTAKNWPNPLIFLGSLVWSCASALGRYAADRGWLKRQRLDARVISVGNIQVGGAGKTPLVARIAREAIEKGLRTCILSRGYRGHWELHGGVILPNSGPADAELCGDEVALLHDLVPQAYIVVGKNRAEQFFKLQKQGTPSIQLVILDDGFQHHKIQKDLEILAMTSAKPSQILFRDFHQASKKADLLVWTQGMPRELSWSGDLVDDSARVVMQYCLAEASRSEWKQTYWLVTGVFQGARVYELACSVGYPIARHLQFKDHFGYTNSAVREILSQASQKGVRVLLPGKDWVKWRSLGVSREEVQVIEPELIFKEGRSNWDQKLWAQQR